MDGKCLTVASLSDGPTSLKLPYVPGVHYCKFVSPARLMDYIMTDSLKAKSGCLYKKSDFGEVFLQ